MHQRLALLHPTAGHDVAHDAVVGRLRRHDQNPRTAQDDTADRDDEFVGIGGPAMQFQHEAVLGPLHGVLEQQLRFEREGGHASPIAATRAQYCAAEAKP